MTNFLKSKQYYIILGLIVALAFGLRFYRITSNPPSLNWDEVSLGYNAFSILKTGKDEWEKVLPLIFQAYGDYKLPLYIYILAPFISAFGLNELSLRLPSAIAGTLTVFFTYLVVKELLNYGSRKEAENITANKSKIELTALFSALFTAVEPWSLFLSRPAFEANLALSFFIIGLYYFLRALTSIRNIYYSLIFFGLTVWTYNSYRIFTPIFLIFLVIVFGTDLLKGIKNKFIITLSIFLILLFFLPMLLQFVSGVGRERYKKVAIIDEGAIGQIVNLRNKYNLNPLAERLLFNRPTYFIYNFSKNILSHFSYKYLFKEGGSNYQFNIPVFGLIYKVNLAFLIIGLLYLIKNRSRISLVLLLWMLLGTVPSSLTREAPHVLRSITMLPVPMIISSVGLVSVIGILSKQIFRIGNLQLKIILRLFVLIYLLILTRSILKYLGYYFNDYRKAFSWSWQYGYKEAVNYIKADYQKYDKIIVTKKYGEPHEFFLFYLSWNPESYQNDNYLIRFKQSDWFWVDRFNKFYFVNDWDIPKEEWQPFVLESKREEIDCRTIKCLLITTKDNVPKKWNKIKTIDFLDGKSAFELYEN